MAKRQPMDFSEDGISNLISELWKHEFTRPQEVEVRPRLKEIVESLRTKDLERFVCLSIRLGLYDGNRRTLEQTGMMIGLRPERVRQYTEWSLSYIRRKLEQAQVGAAH